MLRLMILFLFLFSCVGIDRQMAEHVAHFFIRDPISVFEENLIADDNSLEHFDVSFYCKFLLTLNYVFFVRTKKVRQTSR